MYSGIVVKCQFDIIKDNVSKLSDDYKPKLYSYKCSFSEVKEGDLVIVESPSGDFRAVKVVEVCDSLELSDDIQYKWVASILNLDHYIELKLGDVNALKELRKMKQASIRKQMIQNAGIEESELSRILMIVNGVK